MGAYVDGRFCTVERGKIMDSNMFLQSEVQISSIIQTYAVGLKFFAMRSLYIKPTDPPAIKPKVIAIITIM